MARAIPRRDGLSAMDRRAFCGAVLVLGACSKKNEEAEVTPAEDLMQEHGVVERIVLIYDEGARRIDAGAALDLGVLAEAADLVKRFVEDYHEKSEEEFVFPRLEAARREVELVSVLRRQHERGRELTTHIAALSRAGSPSRELAGLLRAFGGMYRPHAAREDTVLFPAFRELLGDDAYRELGEKFEDREHQRFGEHGFERVVADLAKLEQRFAIADLAKFTPA
jgi:hemerythrin-like domain-containing protein